VRLWPVMLLLLVAVTLSVASAQQLYYDSASGSYVPYPPKPIEVTNPQATIVKSITYSPLATATTTSSTNNNEEQKIKLPAVPVPILNVSYDTYTAMFIGEEKVIVCTGHCDKDLGDRYISVVSDHKAYIYDIKTGKLLKTFSADSNGDVFDLNTGEKVWDRSGFFSGNGRFLVEDAYHYGCDAKVVDLETKQVYNVTWMRTYAAPDPANDKCEYYAIQMDYYGTYIAAGQNNVTNGKLVIYKRVGDEYKPIWWSHEIGQVRRLFFTLDAKIVVFGSLQDPTLYEAVMAGSDFWSIRDIDLVDGVGALTCVDPYKLKMCFVGTSHGHIYIFETDDGGYIYSDPKIYISNETYPNGTGTGGRFYNPFYNRWSPVFTSVAAFSTNTDPYVSIIVDLETGKFYRFTGSGYGRAAAISLKSNYVFAGRTLYMLINPDIQSSEPRVRFHGTAIYNYGKKPQELSTPIVLKAPKDKPYHVYFTAGKVEITSLANKERPVSLVTDSDIEHGLLGRMYEKGLVTYDVIYQDGAEVTDHKMIKKDDRTVVYSRTHVLKNIVISALFGAESVADSGIIIKVPLQGTVSTYSELIQEQSIAVAIAAPVFDWKKELLGAVGLEFVTGAASYATSKALLSDAFSRVVGGQDALMITEALHPKALKAGRILGKAAGVVGIVLMVDAAVEAYTHYIDYSNVKTTMFVVPVAMDTRTGDRYAAVAFILPASEVRERMEEYRKYAESYIKDKLNVKAVGVTFIELGTDWEEYNARLKAGQLPNVNLQSMIEAVAEANGVPKSRLRYVEVDIIIDTITRGYASLFDRFAGGVRIPVVTEAQGAAIQVKGIVPSFVTTDPNEIVGLVPYIEVNGQRYNMSVSEEAAIAYFSLPYGTDALVVRFPNAPYLATLSVSADVLVKVPFKEETYGVYKAEFHYDWENVEIWIDRFEFVDMPYPMKYAERTYRYTYGEYTQEITDAFERGKVTDDPNSPTGKRYYYVTEENTRFIDPTNGGVMQPCKTYIFRYFYVSKPEVGNAWVKVYFNGTSVVSTIPRHATFFVGSNGTDQTVTVLAQIYTKHKENGTIIVDMQKKFTRTYSIWKDEYVMFEEDIQDFVAKALELMKQGKVGFVEVTIEVVKAEVNEIEEDDKDRVIYYPPPKLNKSEQPVQLIVRVVDATNQTPIQNAEVTVDGETDYTNATGEVTFVVPAGLHDITASASGYEPKTEQVNVYDNMTVTIELVKSTAERITPEQVPEYAELKVCVYNYSSLEPIEDARVVIDKVGVPGWYEAFTEADGCVVFPAVVTKIPLKVWAEKTGYLTSPKYDLVLYNDTEFDIYLVPETEGSIPPELNETPVIDTNTTQVITPDVGNATVVIENGTLLFPLDVLVQYKDGTPFDGAQIYIYNNTTHELIMSGKTDGTGYAHFYVPAYSVIDVNATAGTHNFSAKKVWMTTPKLIIFTINETSSYFSPEVEISEVRIEIHRGLEQYYGRPVWHLVVTKLWTNVHQTVDLYLRLFDAENNTIAEKTVGGVELYPGVNVYMDWLEVNITSKDFEDVTVYAKITKYEQDTDPRNNEMVGNTVTLKPFIDMYAVVTWSPVKQKVHYAILPGDVLEIDVGFVIPAKITDVSVSLHVDEHNLKEKRLKSLIGRAERVATHEPTTIWRNFTVVVPYTDKIVVTANISHPLEDFTPNNNFTLVIPIDPDTKVEAARPTMLIVSSGAKVPVTVEITSNAIGMLYFVTVIDDSADELIGKVDINITDTNMTVTVEATAPVITGVYETHIWNASANGADYYDENNYKTFSVSIWNIPWWGWLLIILIVVVFVLSIVKSLIATVRKRKTGEYRFFRRVDEGEEAGDRFSMSTEKRGGDEFRFFRRL